MDNTDAVSEKILSFPGGAPAWGFGLGGFGSNFGYDGEGMGFGLGNFGIGGFGFDCDYVEWVSPCLLYTSPSPRDRS